MNDAALLRDYAGAGFGATLPFGERPALLVIDAVRAYLDAGSPLRLDGDAAIACLARLIAAARGAGAPVLYTQVVYQAGGRDGGHFFTKVPALRCFETGSQLGEIAPAIAPRPGDTIVTKQYPSAFFGTSLASTLHAQGIDTLILGGFSTSGCVRASALDALQHGFRPFVVREAAADRDPRIQAANLFDLQAKYAEVVGEADILAQFARRAAAA